MPHPKYTRPLLLLLLAALHHGAKAQTVKIYGTVTDENKSPVELAQVYVESQLKGTTCDLKGKYSLTCQTEDSLVVTFSMLGYQKRKRVLRNPADSVRLDITLPSLGILVGEVQVSDIKRQTGSVADVNIKGLKEAGNASGMGVESIIATQAGVSTHNELSNQYNVRGGSFDENSVYINGVEVYRPLLIRSGQQEGLSVINPDMVERVGFSAGGFEAKYGDKMSSVLDIQYKKARGLEATASASMLGASLYAGYGNDKLSFTNALRYKTTSYLLSSLQTKGEYSPKDIDYQAYLSWTPTAKWALDLMTNISQNDYQFEPEDRTTKFGTSEDVKEFKVYFDGKEKDKFQTYFGSLTLTHKFNKYNNLSLGLSSFQTKEKETYDISGEYWLNTEATDESLGIGTYMEHARNRLKANVTALTLKGENRFTSHELKYGLTLKSEHVTEHMREWERHDSAGYSLPHTADKLNLIYNMASDNDIKTTRLEAYAQDTYRKILDEGEIILNYGARLTHWSWNGEWTFSPRASVAFIPKANDNLVLRLATGVYYQAPFYKELKDTTTVNGNATVQLNKDIKSQKSIHLVLGAEYRFKVGLRPFKATAEAYYKHLTDLIPYNVDNVRVNYYGKNMASGYALGLDMKLYGEFVPGTDSWISLGIMKTAERLNGKTIPRPTDQRLNMSVFFSDYFPGTDKWKITVKGHYAGGLPFGPPHSGRESQTFRMSPYKRIDIGMSYRLLNNEDHHLTARAAGALRNIWLGLDCFNILDISNVNSYYWVTDVTDNKYAVPNYLTGRQLNIRLTVEL